MFFYALAICETMKHDVTQNKSQACESRLESVMHVRIDSRTLDAFRRIARSESRSPSNLVRKIVTDFVSSNGPVSNGQVKAIPHADQIQTVAKSPWDI